MDTLDQYLTRSGTRQEDFAAMIGVTQATVSRLVRRTSKPSLTLATEIERVTGGAVPATSWVDTKGLT